MNSTEYTDYHVALVADSNALEILRAQYIGETEEPVVGDFHSYSASAIALLQWRYELSANTIDTENEDITDDTIASLKEITEGIQNDGYEYYIDVDDSILEDKDIVPIVLPYVPIANKTTSYEDAFRVLIATRTALRTAHPDKEVWDLEGKISIGVGPVGEDGFIVDPTLFEETYSDGSFDWKIGFAN
jgi:hypothetical protein